MYVNVACHIIFLVFSIFHIQKSVQVIVGLKLDISKKGLLIIYNHVLNVWSCRFSPFNKSLIFYSWCTRALPIAISLHTHLVDFTKNRIFLQTRYLDDIFGVKGVWSTVPPEGVARVGGKVAMNRLVLTKNVEMKKIPYFSSSIFIIQRIRMKGLYGQVLKQG